MVRRRSTVRFRKGARRLWQFFELRTEYLTCREWHFEWHRARMRKPLTSAFLDVERLLWREQVRGQVTSPTRSRRGGGPGGLGGRAVHALGTRRPRRSGAGWRCSVWVVMAVRPFRLAADRLLDLASACTSNEQTRTRQDRRDSLAARQGSLCRRLTGRAVLQAGPSHPSADDTTSTGDHHARVGCRRLSSPNVLSDGHGCPRAWSRQSGIRPRAAVMSCPCLA